MINTQTQIDSLIDLAVIQRTELKQLIESLPQLRDHLSSEIERNLEEIEPAIRSELEQFVAARALDTQAKTSAELGAKLDAMARNLESTTAAKYSVLMAERAENANLLAKAEARIEDAASMLSHAVKEIVTDELSRFPRAGEIDQLRKEFAEPRGLNPRGRWQVGETYNKLDLVSYNGDSYVSSTDGNREKPSRSSEAWTLSAARGNGGGGGGATSLTDLVPVPANGELLIGNGSAFVNNTLTAGTGVTITNGPGTITIDASGAQELLTASVVNAESVPITRGQVVYLFSATGFRPSVKLANNSADATSAKTFGVVSDNSIAANGIGTVTCVGVVDKLALGAYNDGDTVYLGDTAGTITTTKPYAPNHLVYVGIIERANNGNGELYVKIQNGYELDEIHDVQITSAPLAGALLMRDATNSLWKANRLTGTTNQVTVTNADTAVTLSLPTTIANVNSVTAQTTTNLTLTGGSTGASLVLGQGASGYAKIVRNSDGNNIPGLQVKDSATGYSSIGIYSGAADNVFLGLQANALSSSTKLVTFPAYPLDIWVNNTATARFSTGLNLLIGGTTDITGSGGLKVFGTTAASGPNTGALQVAGGIYAGAASVLQDVQLGAIGTVKRASMGMSTTAVRIGEYYIGDNAGVATNISTSGLTQDDASKSSWIATLGAGTDSFLIARKAAGAGVGAWGSLFTVASTGAATFAGAVLNSDGTAAAPSLSFSADTDTGFYRQNTNVIGVSLAGAAAGRFEGDGASGIRFRHPTGNYLGLNNSGAIEVIAAGTNQNITLTPSGTGILTTAARATVTNTTAGSAGAGALVVSGGLATGAASYIGGNLTVGTGSAAVASVLNRGTTAQSSLAQWQTASAANWSVGSGATGTNTNLEFYNHNTASSNFTLNYTTGAATFAGAVTIGGNATGGILRLGGTAPSADQAAEIFLTTSNTAFNWKVLTNTSGPGIFELRQSTAAGGTTFTDAILRITPNVTATSTTVSFLGAVAIGNTTAAAVAAPSTHKVSILIGGVQYYLLASNV